MEMLLGSGDRGERLAAVDLADAGVRPECDQTGDELKAEQTAAHGRPICTPQHPLSAAGVACPPGRPSSPFAGSR
jgi:hypothetical protein